VTLLPKQSGAGMPARRLACLALSLGLAAGCSDFLRVSNPDVIDATTLDPSDALTIDVFARSAQTAFASVYGDLVRFGGIFTTELQYLDTSEPESQFAVRSVSPVNLSNPVTLWGPLSSARTQSDKVLLLLRGAPGGTATLNGTRAALFAGYAIELMAETYCEGTLADVATLTPGPPLTRDALLDTAVARFTAAIDGGTVAAQTLTGAALAEVTSFVNAARVGRARAQLQRGRRTQAAADAATVPAGFTYSLLYVDDASNRTRVSNRLWQFTLARGQLSVPPAYRALADPRVAFLNPTSSLPGADGSPLYAQQKYPAYNSPIRLASRLEADYIAAEAQLPAVTAALALIGARRTAAGQGAYAGGSDSASVLAELLDQRARDFYLEGKRLGDLARAAGPYQDVGLIRYMLPTGAAYFTRPSLGAVGSQTCFPLPQQETLTNPNFPRG
jgi:starch-binding outer membrane protein, SusD/RagB family